MLRFRPDSFFFYFLEIKKEIELIDLKNGYV
jgi:hypothetical protein